MNTRNSLKNIFRSVAVAGAPLALLGAHVPAHALIETQIPDTCFSLRDKQDDSQHHRVQKLLGELEKISQMNTYLATDIYQKLHKKNPKVCYAETGGGAGAVWKIGRNEIVLSNASYEPDSLKLSYLFHEMVHGDQDRRKLLRQNMGWSPYELQQSLLSYEAAAKTAQYVISYDLYRYGYTAIWESDKKYARQNGIGELEKAYLENYAATADHSQALKAAASAQWQATTTNQQWLDFYNQGVIKRYLSRYQSGAIQSRSRRAPVNLNDVQTSIDLADGSHLLSGVEKLPSDFGTNQAFKNIMDHMQVEHYAAKYGRDSDEYKTAYIKYAANDNPYRTVDLKQVPRNAQNITMQFDCLAKHYECEKVNGEYKRKSLFKKWNGKTPISSPDNHIRFGLPPR